MTRLRIGWAIALACTLAGCGGGSSTPSPVSSSASAPTNASGTAQLRFMNGPGGIFQGPCGTAPNPNQTNSFYVDGVAVGSQLAYGTITNYQSYVPGVHAIRVNCGNATLIASILTPSLAAGASYTVVLAGTALGNAGGFVTPGQTYTFGTLELAFFIDPPPVGPTIRFYNVAPSAPSQVDFGTYAAQIATRLGSAAFAAANLVPAYVAPSNASNGATPVPLPNAPQISLTPNPVGETVVGAPSSVAAPPGLTIYAGIGTVPFATPSPSPSPTATAVATATPPGIVGPTAIPTMVPTVTPQPIPLPGVAFPVGVPFSVGNADPLDAQSLFPFGSQAVFSVFLIDEQSAAGGSIGLPPQLIGVLQ